MFTSDLTPRAEPLSQPSAFFQARQGTQQVQKEKLRHIKREERLVLGLRANDRSPQFQDHPVHPASLPFQALRPPLSLPSHFCCMRGLPAPKTVLHVPGLHPFPFTVPPGQPITILLWKGQGDSQLTAYISHAKKPGSIHHLLAEGPRESHGTVQSLAFFICEMGARV